jgi:ribosomal protein L37AE/L43A
MHNTMLEEMNNNINIKYTCPCCGYKTHIREDSLWDICEVCFWQNDPPSLDDPYYQGGANAISLIQAQANFIAFGACEECSLNSVRDPLPDEPKDENWKPYTEPELK